MIEDHPSCTGADKTTFQVPFAFGNLDYALYDAAEGVFVFVSGGTIHNEQECYVTEGFGTDGVQVPVSCQSAVKHDYQKSIDAFALSINMNGDITACVSPMGTAVVASAWDMTVSGVAGDLVYHDGLYRDRNVDQKENAVVSSDTLPSVTFEYYGFPYVSGAPNWLDWRFPDYDFSTAASNLQISVDCIPIYVDQDEAVQVFAGFDVSLDIRDVLAPACSGADCPPSGLSGNWPRQRLETSCFR